MSSQDGSDRISPADEKDTGVHFTDEKEAGVHLSDKGGVETEIEIAQVEELAEKLGDGQGGIAPVGDVEFVMDKVEALTVEECRQILRTLLEEHKHDYNFSNTQREKLQSLIQGPSDGQTEDEWELQLKTETAVNKFYSPYPEVRSVAVPQDTSNMLCETVRAHLLGYFWAAVSQFVNSLFNSRFPSINVTAQMAQILLYPCGKALALLPDWGFTMFGRRMSINPGPWTYKEQMLSTIIFNVSVQSAYVFWNIQTQEIYYHDTWLTPAYKILLLLSTQAMGLGFAGLLRRYAIYPIYAIWPNQLPVIALNRALLTPEKKETLHGWSISRYRFFFIAFAGMFVYYWLPGFLFPALSLFSWMTWISPSNFNLAVITGGDLGLGFNPISSFDWNVQNQNNLYPLAVPFFAYLQQYAGTFLGGLAIIGIYYSNIKGTAYLPPNSSGIFDNQGNSYNISQVVINGVLDEEAYQAYSPAFYSAGNLVTYGAFFAFYPLTMLFVILDTWRELGAAFSKTGRAIYGQAKYALSSLGQAFKALGKGNFREFSQHLRGMSTDSFSVYEGFDDPFTILMRNYPEVPDWWFLMIVLVSFVFAIIILSVYQELGAPVWSIFFVIGLNLAFLIPATFMQAFAGVQQGLNVIAELVMGYALPGHPEALMFVKAFGYMIGGQADTFTSDLKMGHYTQIPPRAMFRGQVISTILTAFVAYGVIQYADNDIAGICTTDQAQDFNCENGSQIYFSSSVIWGAIGPKKIFNEIYPELKYCFLFGFLLALVWWSAKHWGGSARGAMRKKLPTAIFRPLNWILLEPLSWLEHVHPSLLFNGALWWAPTNLAYKTSGLYLSGFFMYYMRRYKTAWFEKYLYVLSAALTAGVAFSAIIIFFAVQYHPVTLDWWGVDVTLSGDDNFAGQTALLPLPDQGFFGPSTWT